MDATAVFTAGQQGLWTLLLVAAPVLLVILVTEFASNVATASGFMPVLPATNKISADRLDLRCFCAGARACVAANR